MRIINLLPFLRRLALASTGRHGSTLCRLNVFCQHDSASQLRRAVQQQLAARGLSATRLSVSFAADSQLACLSVLLVCPGSRYPAFGELVAHFSREPQVYRVQWGRKLLQPGVPSAAFLLAQGRAA